MHRSNCRKTGFSLIEVMVASTVLITGIAVMMHLTHVGSSQSRKSRELAIAQVECQMCMNELASGAATIDSVPGRPIDGLNDWSLWIDVLPGPMPSLAEVRVSARKIDPRTLESRGSYSLVRWIPSDSTSASTSANTNPSKNPFGNNSGNPFDTPGAVSSFSNSSYEDDPFGDSIFNDDPIGGSTFDSYPPPGDSYEDDPFGDRAARQDNTPGAVSRGFSPEFEPLP